MNGLGKGLLGSGPVILGEKNKNLKSFVIRVIVARAFSAALIYVLFSLNKKKEMWDFCFGGYFRLRRMSAAAAATTIMTATPIAM